MTHFLHGAEEAAWIAGGLAFLIGLVRREEPKKAAFWSCLGGFLCCAALAIAHLP